MAVGASQRCSRDEAHVDDDARVGFAPSRPPPAPRRLRRAWFWCHPSVVRWRGGRCGGGGGRAAPTKPASRAEKKPSRLSRAETPPARPHHTHFGRLIDGIEDQSRERRVVLGAGFFGGFDHGGGGEERRRKTSESVSEVCTCATVLCINKSTLSLSSTQPNHSLSLVQHNHGHIHRPHHVGRHRPSEGDVDGRPPAAVDDNDCVSADRGGRVRDGVAHGDVCYGGSD